MECRSSFSSTIDSSCEVREVRRAGVSTRALAAIQPTAAMVHAFFWRHFSFRDDGEKEEKDWLCCTLTDIMGLQ